MLPYFIKRHILLHMIVCSLIIMFQCDHPFVSFDTYIYIYLLI